MLKKKRPVTNSINLIAAKINPLVETISISLDEKISASMSKDGDLLKFEVKGDVYLYVNDASGEHAEIHLSMGDTKGITFQFHPNLNKSLWLSKQIITTKQDGFPVGVQLEAIKYTYIVTNPADLPFLITVWSSKEEKGGKLNVVTLEVEYNSNNTKFSSIENMKVIIPLGVTKQPQVESHTNHIDNQIGKFRSKLRRKGKQARMVY